ncbi:MAG: hypothetical protein HKO71_07670 [Pseudomonadales bacterium]|nr:hypothetical protein [Pseudomonadales bacterium]
MLYLIAGASKSGKSIIAKRILAQKNLPYLSLDWLVMGFTNGVPEYGLHDKLMPDEIAERIWPFLQAMLDNMLFAEVDYVIEGEAILPELITGLLKKYPGQIKIGFLGYADVDRQQKFNVIKTYRNEKDDYWLLSESDNYIYQHIDNMITFSRRLEKDCAKYGMDYFETASDFMGVLERAKKLLLSKQ